MEWKADGRLGFYSILLGTQQKMAGVKGMLAMLSFSSSSSYLEYIAKHHHANSSGDSGTSIEKCYRWVMFYGGIQGVQRRTIGTKDESQTWEEKTIIQE